MMDPFVITPAEFAQCEAQFNLLLPQNGLLTGLQLRDFFMKSGLSAPVLGQIWQLSDINRDGKLDKYEFGIAMTLIRRHLAGTPLPAHVPPSLLSSLTAPSFGQPPVIPAAIPSRPPAAPVYNTMPSSPLKHCSDWSLPLPSKHKYRQQFYENDRQNTGVMNGNQARFILSQSGLPTPVLADVWALADVNNDGMLSSDEFVVAMHLIDMYKMGYTLPKNLPPELLDMFPGAGGEADRNKKSTYDDKFMDSYNRGLAELERRRQIAREEEERQRLEAENREREERERRERERQELERRRAAEREAERQKELERERLRREEEDKIKAERDAIRKKLEDERLKELERIRIRELENQKQTEAEKTAQIQQRHKNMAFQLQALQEKVDALNEKVSAARDRIVTITTEIEQMRGSRDEKLQKMMQLQQTQQQLNIHCERISHEHLQLQSENKVTHDRAAEVERLKNEISAMIESIPEHEAAAKLSLELLDAEKTKITEKQPLCDATNNRLNAELSAYNDMVKRAAELQSTLRGKATPLPIQSPPVNSAVVADPFLASSAASSFDHAFPPFEAKFEAKFDDAFGSSHVTPVTSPGQAPVLDPFASASHHHDHFAAAGDPFASSGSGNLINPTTGGGGAPIKYRAIYEFVARSDDELNLQPGDLILVFDSQSNAEPGWLAGQVKGKVGWFPASFAEPITPGKKSSIPTVITSPSSEPLASITEEPAENTVVAAPEPSIPNGTYDSPPAAPALYEDPPVSLPAYELPPVAEPPAQVPQQQPAADQFALPSYDAPPELPPPSNSEKPVASGVALYKWNSTKEGDLSFNKGEEIDILEQTEMKWRGRIVKEPSRHGWFPKSYVKVTGSQPTSPEKQQQPPPPTTTATTTNTTTPSSPEKSQAPNGNAPLTMAPSPDDGEWYVALWSFDAVESTDLSLKPGDRIWVTDRNDQWWKGTVNGQTGIFPATYVQKASEVVDPKSPVAVSNNIARALANFDATADNQISLKVGDLIKIRSTSPTGWWEGEISLPSGENKTGWFPGNYVEVLTATATSPLSNAATPVT